MKTPRNLAVMAAGAFFVLWVGCVGAQTEKKERADTAVTVAEILKTAKVPLNEEQSKQLKEFDPSQGRELFQKLFQLFNEKQNDALKKALGVMPARNDMPETPRSLFLVVILENLKCPLTQKQIDQFKELPTDQGSWQKMNDILNDTQKEAMKKAFGR